MTEYVHLVGAADVRTASRTISEAAHEMNAAANSIHVSLYEHRRYLEEFISRLEAAMRTPQEKRAAAAAARVLDI